MLDPNERLRRLYENLNEKISTHRDKKTDYEECCDEEPWIMSDADLYRFNYFYHLGAKNALESIQYIFRCWGASSEEWFKLAKDE